MLDIYFEEGFPQELQPVVVDLLEKYGPYFCRNVDRFHVHHRELGGATAKIEVLERYRVALLHLSPVWFNSPDDYREKIMVHELGHLMVNPLCEHVELLLEQIKDNDALQEVLGNQYVALLEGLTEDISRAIYKAHTGKQPPLPELDPEG